MTTTTNKKFNKNSIILVFLVMVLLSACSGGAANTATSVPTQILIPATATNTPEQPTATPTLAPAIAPNDLLPTPVRADIAHLEELEQEIALLTIDHLLAYDEQASPQSIQVAHVDNILWRSPLEDCAISTDFGDAEISGVQLFLFFGNTVYDYHADKVGNVVLCNQQSISEVSGELLLQLDPVAEEMVAIAKRRVATELDLPTQRIQFVDIYATTWPDSSLGCPAPDQTYDEAQIKGYRLVVSAAEQEYIFHTDFDGLIQCLAEQEVLPEDAIAVEETPEAEITPDVETNEETVK